MTDNFSREFRLAMQKRVSICLSKNQFPVRYFVRNGLLRDRNAHAGL